MCDPISLTGAALSGASVLANSAASNQVAGARNRVLAAERQRQQGFQQQEAALTDHSRSLYDNFGGQQAQRGQSLGDYFNRGNDAPPGAGGAGSTAPSETLPASSNTLVQNEQQRQGAKAADYSKQQGDALGQLRAFGDVLGTAGRAQARDAGAIDQLSNFSRGSASITPYELEAANAKGSGLRTLGDILQGAGQLGVAAGLGRNVAGAAGAAGGGVSLPAFAQPQATAPLSLGTTFSAIPTFAGVGNLFGVR